MQRWLSERRTAPAKSTPHRWRSLPSGIALSRSSDGSTRLLSPKQLAWLLVQSPEALDGSQRAMLARIEQDAEVCRLLPLAHRFTDVIGTCSIRCGEVPVNPEAVLDSWLVDAHASGIRAVQTFATGLQQDEAASRRRSSSPGATGKPKDR